MRNLRTLLLKIIINRYVIPDKNILKLRLIKAQKQCDNNITDKRDIKPDGSEIKILANEIRHMPGHNLKLVTKPTILIRTCD